MIKKRENRALKKIKRPHILFNFRYPKFFILILTFVLAYFLFKAEHVEVIEPLILHNGYFGTFIAGFLFSWAFTAAPAAVLFLLMAGSQNIFLAVLIGSLGALIGDLLVFHFIRFSFKNEIDIFEKEKVVVWIDKKIPEKIRHYLLVIFADILLASPLPDELAVVILATHSKISVKVFSIMTYILHAIGIFVILLIGSAI